LNTIHRSSRIALLNYIDGEKRYIIAPSKMTVGDPVISGEMADIKPVMPFSEEYSAGNPDSQRGA